MRVPGMIIPVNESTDRLISEDQQYLTRAAVLIVADTTYTGTRTERIRQLILRDFEEDNILLRHFEVVPNEASRIRGRIAELKARKEIDYIFATSGAMDSLKFVLSEFNPGIIRTGQSVTQRISTR